MTTFAFMITIGMNKLVRFTILLFAVMMAMPIMAQKKKLQNRPYIDQRPFHYGIMTGINIQDMELQNNGFITAEGEQWMGEVDSYNPGFSVGLVGEMRLTDHLALRTVPSMHFGDKRVVFREMGSGELYRQTVKSTYLSVPVDVKFSAERFNNYRPYVIAGVNTVYDLTSKHRQALRLNRFDCMLELGVGCDFYMPFFKLIPELKFCYGLSNLVNKNNDDLTDTSMLRFRNQLDGAHAKMIVLSFYFE